MSSLQIKDNKYQSIQNTKLFFKKLNSLIIHSQNHIISFIDDISKIQNNDQTNKFNKQKLKNNIFNQVNTILLNKQTQAFKQIIQNIQTKSQPFHINQKIKQQNRNIQKLQLIQKLSQKQSLNSIKKIQSKTSLIAVKQYINNLQNQSAQKTHIQQNNNLEALIVLMNQIYQNNRYLCKQMTFETIKQLFFIQKTSYQNPSSRKLLASGTSGYQNQFNLQLTMLSKISKNSINFQRQDSLIYSNATSFGIKNTQNNVKSKQLRNSSSKRSRKNNPDQIDMIVIDKTSSKGSVQNNQERFSSARSISDNGKALKYPPRMSYQNKSDRSHKSINNSQEEPKNQRKKTDLSVESVKSPIKQEDNYEIEQYASSYKKKKIQNSNIKKTFSIKSYGKMRNSHVKSIKGQQISVFSTQMQQLQNRIGKIKDSKLLKRKKLEDQLTKINRQIQQIKKQQQKVDQKNNIPQNTLQSRIQIDDNYKSKKMAVNLVRNLKNQKQSRQKKRKQVKLLDHGLNEQMKQIMQLRYFNEQRVKQKKKLEIIQRMKKQQIRKIQQQRQVQQSNHFLLKIKQESQVSSQALSQVKPNKINQSPIRRSAKKQSRQKQIIELIQNPIIQKRKVVIHKVRNLTIIKKPKQDLYEQALS